MTTAERLKSRLDQYNRACAILVTDCANGLDITAHAIELNHAFWRGDYATFIAVVENQQKVRAALWV